MKEGDSHDHSCQICLETENVRKYHPANCDCWFYSHLDCLQDWMLKSGGKCLICPKTLSAEIKVVFWTTDVFRYMYERYCFEHPRRYEKIRSLVILLIFLWFFVFYIVYLEWEIIFVVIVFVFSNSFRFFFGIKDTSMTHPVIICLYVVSFVLYVLQLIVLFRIGVLNMWLHLVITTNFMTFPYSVFAAFPKKYKIIERIKTF